MFMKKVIVFSLKQNLWLLFAGNETNTRALKLLKLLCRLLHFKTLLFEPQIRKNSGNWYFLPDRIPIDCNHMKDMYFAQKWIGFDFHPILYNLPKCDRIYSLYHSYTTYSCLWTHNPYGSSRQSFIYHTCAINHCGLD